ncbi:MAG: ABC transporter permease [Bacteroidaceae bacterium]|nr:ABC transporter permease [Bacteroidaceae bacterium]MEA5099893.1 ABC transporter permease [Bacteroidales bacterium]
MSKTGIIIRREYFIRVKKKSFLVMTFLGPILIASLWIIPFFLALNSDTQSKVLVVDETLIEKNGIKSSLYLNKFKKDNELIFEYGYDIKEAQEKLTKGDYDAVLEIVSTNDMPPIKGFLFYSENEPSLSAQSAIQSQLSNILKDHVLKYDYGMNDKDLEWFNNPKIGFYSKDIRSGKDSYKEIKTFLAIIAGICIYMFIFMFGAQVMKSVSEEKTSRIVEVLVSSIKPVQLLMGKIVAVGLVGLTQLVLWLVLSVVLIGGLRTVYPQTFSESQKENITINERVISVDKVGEMTSDSSQVNQVVQGLFSIDYTLVILMFVFYFITGYLLYAALFGAVGALIDVDTDAQQFTLPITIPLIIAMVCFPIVINAPSGGVAFWLSMIPLTSPMVMMMRIPFGVPIWEIATSMGLIILFIIFCMWFAAKIYRTGILMYGKNITYKEIWKWFKYNN